MKIFYLQSMNASNGEFISTLITYGIIFFVAIYVTRLVFGIDKIIENQHKTNALLQELLKKTNDKETDKEE
jgi:membrane-anchored glycerophosphoryl diester phosphodiesterase (GDPDase)